jgi:hypothetical protein
MVRRIVTIATTAMLVVFMAKSLTLMVKLRETQDELDSTKTKLEQVEQELEIERNRELQVKDDSLSEWDMFTLALMKVESEYKPTAVSSVGAKGYFQIMPIYVAEVNRVHKTNFVYEDVVASFEQSYEVFTLMQEAHNKEYDMDKALELHNGDHKWYRKRVYNEMANIELYEEMREKVKNIDVI